MSGSSQYDIKRSRPGELCPPAACTDACFAAGDVIAGVDDGNARELSLTCCTAKCQSCRALRTPAVRAGESCADEVQSKRFGGAAESGDSSGVCAPALAAAEARAAARGGDGGDAGIGPSEPCRRKVSKTCSRDWKSACKTESGKAPAVSLETTGGVNRADNTSSDSLSGQTAGLRSDIGGGSGVTSESDKEDENPAKVRT